MVVPATAGTVPYVENESKPLRMILKLKNPEEKQNAELPIKNRLAE